MGNNSSICSCNNHDINTESNIIKEDSKRNELYKKNSNDPNNNDNKDNRVNLKEILNSFQDQRLKEIALNNYAKKLTSFIILT